MLNTPTNVEVKVMGNPDQTSPDHLNKKKGSQNNEQQQENFQHQQEKLRKSEEEKTNRIPEDITS